MKRILALAIVGLMVVALAAYTLTYGLSDRALVVTDGSITGVIEGNFALINSSSALISYFNATTVATQPGYPSSTVSLLLRTDTYFDAGSGAVRMTFVAIALGRLASDLRPSGITLTYNQTGTNISVDSIPGGVWFTPGYQAPDNVSFNPEAGFSFLGGGTGRLSAALVGETGVGAYYQFRYAAEIDTMGRPQYNHVIGLRADLAGLGVPVGVGIVLKIINASGGIWT